MFMVSFSWALWKALFSSPFYETSWKNPYRVAKKPQTVSTYSVRRNEKMLEVVMRWVGECWWLCKKNCVQECHYPSKRNSGEKKFWVWGVAKGMLPATSTTPILGSGKYIKIDRQADILNIKIYQRVPISFID